MMAILNTLATLAPIIELIGLIAAAVAIKFAVQHAHNLNNLVGEMRHQAGESKNALGEMHRQAEESKDALTEMQKSISTQYIGSFPVYFKNIVALIDEAQQRIEILCDVTAYGTFSSRKVFKEYRNKLEEKLDDPNLTVEITFLGKEARSALFKEQFIADWERKKRSGDFGKHWADFRDVHRNRFELDSLTPDAFLVLMEEECDRMETETLLRATKTATKAHVPLYFWLIDNRKAIFSIPILSEEVLEHGFVTIDSSFIKAFSAIRKRYDSSRDLPAAAPVARPSA